MCYLKILCKSESEKEQSEKSEKEKSEQYWLQVKIPRKFCTSEKEVLKLRIFRLFSVALLIILLKWVACYVWLENPPSKPIYSGKEILFLVAWVNILKNILMPTLGCPLLRNWLSGMGGFGAFWENYFGFCGFGKSLSVGHIQIKKKMHTTRKIKARSSAQRWGGLSCINFSLLWRIVHT